MISTFAHIRAKIESLINIKTSIKEFFSSDILYYAASLSFYTIFSIIPILLIALTIITTLPDFEIFIVDIKEMLFTHLLPDRSEALSGYIDTVLQNGIKMGFMGVLYALFTSYLFYSNYEYIVSKIFSKPQRTFLKSLATYLALMFFTPLVFALIIFMTSGLSSSMKELFTFINLPFQTLFSFILSWLMFFTLMKISSNNRSTNKAQLISALITSVVWYIGQKLFISYIFANTTYESLYGSFSSILFFFLWIYISWIIYLYGLKSTASIQKYLNG
jgi:membrane protein